MKFSTLPLKTKKTLLLVAELFFLIGYIFLDFLIPKTSAWYYSKYILLVAMIVAGNMLRVMRNLEEGLAKNQLRPQKYIYIITIVLSGAFALTLCLLLIHH